MDTAELPEDVKEQLGGFEAAVAAVEQGLEPLLAADRRDMEAALTPLERAKVHVTLANAVSTLFCSASPPRSPMTHFPSKILSPTNGVRPGRARDGTRLV